VRPTTQVSGGNRIAHRMRQIKENLQKNSAVYVGLPKGAGTYEDGAPIAVIGAVHEFGSADGHIPERSFLRVPLRAERKEFGKIIKMQIPRIMDGQLTSRDVMEQVGAKAVGVSQEAISAGIQPPNADSTVRRKGSATPLKDEGFLSQNITYVIEEGDE